MENKNQSAKKFSFYTIIFSLLIVFTTIIYMSFNAKEKENQIISLEKQLETEKGHSSDKLFFLLTEYNHQKAILQVYDNISPYPNQELYFFIDIEEDAIIYPIGTAFRLEVVNVK